METLKCVHFQVYKKNCTSLKFNKAGRYCDMSVTKSKNMTKKLNVVTTQ